ncbi:MAG: PAS domain S-box protein, partial [Methanosarcinaceae archaeon]|nr:PAS domain S-box protein [Methanosarcinaceae archaeon]
MIRILLVDDEPAFLDLSKTFLELYNPNAEIDIADSAEKALSKLWNKAYDIIISDYAMPGMDGLAFLEKIRDMEIKVPFIMFSGKGKEEVLREVFEYDMAFHFQKQANPEIQFFELSQRIRQIMKEKWDDEMLHISRLALENCREAVCWLDINSRFININSAACELLGFSRQEMLGRSMKDLDREFKLEHWHYYWKELRREKHLLMESFVRRRDGCEIPLEINSNFVEYGSGEYNCAFLRDITERKIKEKELNLAQFSINNAPDAIFWVTKSGELIYVNDSACKLLGYSKKELLDLRFRDIDPAAGERRWKELWEAARKDKCCTFESFYSGRAGKAFPVESSLKHLSYANKEYLCVYSRDISKRLQADAEFRASEERMNLAIRGARIGAWDLNTLTDELVVSEDWLKILGYSTEEFGNTLEKFKQTLLHPEELADIERELRKHLEGKTPLYRAEHRLLRGNGDWIWILSYGEVVARDEEGRSLRMSGIHLDITEMHNNREALRQSNEKIKLLSNINRHDIQNQISIAAGYLGLIKSMNANGKMQSPSTPSPSSASILTPSTSNPSTSIPSTSTPSTSNPSTSNPSTSNPSTSTPSSCPSS